MILEEKLTVMQVRSHYSIVYQFKPQLRLDKKDVKTQQDFVKFIKELTTNWKDGDYFLKAPQGTFAYFNLNGKRVKLLKKNRFGKEYLCWGYFQPVKRVTKNGTAKKNGTVKRNGVSKSTKIVSKRVSTRTKKK